MKKFLCIVTCLIGLATASAAPVVAVDDPAQAAEVAWTKEVFEKKKFSALGYVALKEGEKIHALGIANSALSIIGDVADYVCEKNLPNEARPATAAEVIMDSSVLAGPTIQIYRPVVALPSNLDASFGLALDFFQEKVRRRDLNRYSNFRFASRLAQHHARGESIVPFEITTQFLCMPDLDEDVARALYDSAAAAVAFEIINMNLPFVGAPNN